MWNLNGEEGKSFSMNDFNLKFKRFLGSMKSIQSLENLCIEECEKFWNLKVVGKLWWLVNWRFAHLKIQKVLDSLVPYGWHGQANFGLGRVCLVYVWRVGGTAKPDFGLAVPALCFWWLSHLWGRHGQANKWHGRAYLKTQMYTSLY